MAIAIGGALYYIILLSVIAFFTWLFRQFDVFGTARERKGFTYQQMAENFDLWNKYVNDDDPENEKNMTRSQHMKYSVEEKLQMLTNRFGKEK